MEAKSFSTCSLVFLCSLSLLTNLQITSSSPPTQQPLTKSHKDYIRNACNSTLYPKDCFKSLSLYASAVQSNPEKLCRTALNLTLTAARAAASVIASQKKLKGLSRNDTAVIKDCAENVDDSIDWLKQSLRAMANLRGWDRAFQLDNVRTWMSAALSDETTCSDEFEEMTVKKSVQQKISKSVLNLYRMTSNFLALMNNLHNYY